MTQNAKFDYHAASHDEDLNRALVVSGEDKDYFARGRMRWLAAWLQRTGRGSASVLDFGCGTGSATPSIHECLAPSRISGVDVPEKSLRVAREKFGAPGVDFRLIPLKLEESRFEVAFCNWVFHHIPPEEREESLRYVHRSLKPGGILALFENNPWNPATRYVMSRCVFDRDAIPLLPTETRRRTRAAGFEVLGTRFLFIFPAVLKLLRALEGSLSLLPFGTQYVVIGKKP